jgi:glycerol-3-phosphate dehydrogenase (NAD(P)+)
MKPVGGKAHSLARGRRPGRAARVATLSRDSIGILGHGAFGTALASLLTGCDLSAVLYCEDEEARGEINRHHRSASLPGVTLAKKVVAIADPEELCQVCRVLVVAVSARAVEAALEPLAGYLDERHTIAHAVGGLADGERRVSQVIRAATPVRRVVALAGPALPADLLARRASALVAAAEQPEALDDVKRLLHHPPVLRIYKSADLPGVELASALSGGLAVVLGMADGAGLGRGPRTVLTTRAVAEMATLVGASGGDLRTAYGMAGLGNLLARTADGGTGSREYELGLAIGRGDAMIDRQVAGARALVTGGRLAALLGVNAPIIQAACEVLDGRIDLDEAIERLSGWETDHE